MRRVKAWKWVLVGALIVLGLYFLYPTLVLTFGNPTGERADELRKKALKIGLDLKGGVHLVMELDKSKLPEDVEEPPIAESIEIIRNRIDQFGVTEPVIQKVGDNRIIVELPGLDNPTLAKEIIGKTALLEFKLLARQERVKAFVDSVDALLENTPRLAAIITGEEPEEKAAEDTLLAQKPEEAVEESAVTVQKAGEIIEGEDLDKTIPSTIEEETEEKLFTSTVTLMGNVIAVPPYEYDRIKQLMSKEEVLELVPQGLELAWGNKEEKYHQQTFRPLYLLQKKAELTGQYLADAEFTLASPNDLEAPNQPIVNLTFDKTGERLFSRVTGANIDKRLAIVLDGVVHSAPVIRQKIRGGKARISGIESLDEAKALAIVLRAGALPAPLRILEERTVGPMLGEDSVRKGILSILIGSLIIGVFVLFYYRGTGLIALVAVVLNLFLLMAAMSTVRATLTLPGIAGIILTVGMALDANVLIFERIREELRNKKSVAAAVDGGYSKAFWTIFDANLTTLIAAIVLYRFGSGPVRGFAVTLSFGIVISMFTAIFVTRMIMDWIIAVKRPKTLSI